MPIDVSAPNTEWLTSGSPPKYVAFMWHSLTNGRGIISGESGFIMKLKSITLGERDDLKYLWPPVGGGTLHNWHFGEVHILEAAGVIPNAARNGLEPGIQTELLHAEIQKEFAKLNGIADRTRGARRARASQDGLQKRTEDLQTRATETNANPAEVFSDAIKLKNEIEEAIRALKRTTRGRYARQLSPEENEIGTRLDDLKKIAQTIEHNARRAAQATITDQPSNQQRPLRPIARTSHSAQVAPVKTYLKEIVYLTCALLLEMT